LTVQPARNILGYAEKMRFEIPILGNSHALPAISDRRPSRQCQSNAPTEATGWGACALSSEVSLERRQCHARLIN